MNKEQLSFFNECTKNYQDKSLVEYLKKVVEYQLSKGVMFERICWLFDGTTIAPHSAEINPNIPLMINDWLDKRTIGVLKREGITTVGNLLKITRHNLFSIPGIGRKSFSDITGYLGDLGLTL